jgi:two-component system response regulator YesN
MKGNTPEYLEEERRFLVGLVEQQVRQTTCQLAIGVGSSKQRIADIYQSFVEALISAQNLAGGRAAGPHDQVDRAELLKVDKSAVEDYLRCGVREDFDSFFDAFIRPLGEAVFKSSMIKNYVFIDLVLTTARFVSELGGEVSQIVPSLDQVESALANLTTLDQIKDQVSRILLDALAFRDSQASQHHARMARQARDYIDLHYMDQTISLNQVAAYVNHSPSHFSVVFGQQVGQTFKEYLVQVRLKKAKELLRATSLKSSEIAYQVGYGDPHYFSYMFRKNTGLTPTEFRAQTQTEP